MDIPEWAQHLIAIVLGIIVIAILIWRLSPIIFFRFRSIAVSGRITNWMSMKEKGVAYFYPMIEFETLEGRKMNLRADDRCEGRPLYPVGTKITVHYDKKDPKNLKVVYPKI